MATQMLYRCSRLRSLIILKRKSAVIFSNSESGTHCRNTSRNSKVNIRYILANIEIQISDVQLHRAFVAGVPGAP